MYTLSNEETQLDLCLACVSWEGPVIKTLSCHTLQYLDPSLLEINERYIKVNGAAQRRQNIYFIHEESIFNMITY